MVVQDYFRLLMYFLYAHPALFMVNIKLIR